MNIFTVNNDPVIAAQELPDCLVVKMPTESAQMLSTVFRLKMGDDLADSLDLMKSYLWNHPCNLWLAESSANYEWLVTHGVALCNEHFKRYDNEFNQRSFDVITRCLGYINHSAFDSFILTPFVQCMLDQYKIKDDPISAYQKYLKEGKDYTANPSEGWARASSIPDWVYQYQESDLIRRVKNMIKNKKQEN